MLSQEFGDIINNMHKDYGMLIVLQQGIFMKIHKMSDNDHHYSEADSSTQEDTNSLFGKISSDDKEANVNTVIYKETEADNDKTFDKDPVNADKGKLTSMESENHVNEKSDPGLKIEFPCEYCNQILRSEEALYIHLRDHNEKQCANEFLCNHCGKIYHSKKGLSRHMRCHTKNMFKCSFCDKEFYENTDLTSHIRSVHTGEFPFICSYCEKKFAGKKQYRAHLKIHDGTQLKYNCNYCDKNDDHTDATNEDTILKPKEKGKGIKRSKKRYFCTVCTYSTLCCSNFKRHLKTHQPKMEDEVPVQYVCDQCGKQFVSRYGLTLHNRSIHKKTFKYMCETCGKGFNQKYQFSNHCRKHIRLSVKFCPICNEKCPSHDSLIEHFESCHPKNDLDPDQEQLRCRFCLTLCASKKALYSHVKGKHEPPTYHCQHCDKYGNI
ncbi:hypothetical protein KUTeg_010168 [Tegillarca granosa]|uniref:C2H2-type domain-containing protein n=1 Tax=Tegillarca granosa TaxID=220873 RepID=A0ABQ9FAZ0_TEGGR|nr:hypothetical protein KUTeg_010041 [Tegillarca granosa]KAJ8312795.1 hypothetical protein KUTeg_010168 [Tegillarca granosa]